MPLTKRQKQILDYIDDVHRRERLRAELRGDRRALRLLFARDRPRAPENLERKGYIRKSYNESRSIELVRPGVGAAAIELPLLGAVAAGLPIEAIQDAETLAVPPDLVRASSEQLRAPRPGQLHDRRADPGRRLHRGERPANGRERRDGGRAGGRRVRHGQEALPGARRADPPAAGQRHHGAASSSTPATCGSRASWSA